MEIFLMIVLIVFVGLCLYLICQVYVTRSRVLKRVDLYQRKEANAAKEKEGQIAYRPNWGIFLQWGSRGGGTHSSIMLKEIANVLHSEIAFFLQENPKEPGRWYIPHGGLYPKHEYLRDVDLGFSDDIVKQTLSEYTVVYDNCVKDVIPKGLRKLGIESFIATYTTIKHEATILVICKSTEKHGRDPYQVSYSLNDRSFASIMGKALQS